MKDAALTLGKRIKRRCGGEEKKEKYTIYIYKENAMLSSLQKNKNTSHKTTTITRTKCWEFNGWPSTATHVFQRNYRAKCHAFWWWAWLGECV